MTTIYYDTVSGGGQAPQSALSPAGGGQGGGIEEADDQAYAGQAAVNKVRQRRQLGIAWHFSLQP